MTLFDKVKETAKEKGYTLAELARLANIGEKSIYTWKPSKTYPNGITPTHEKLKAVAEILNVSVDYLLGNTDEKNPHSNKNEDSKADLAEIIDDTPILSFNGRPISDRQREIIKQILELGDD